MAILQLNQRTGTAAQWTSEDPTLLAGEIGYESDTGYFKWGDGTTAWTSLPYHKLINLQDVGSSTATNRNVLIADGTDWESRALVEADVSDLQSYVLNSEVDQDIKTLSLPASTTISAFGATLVDDADAATARTTLGVDAAGTDNSTDVTLGGTGTYISIAGQVITVDPITESDISDLGSYLPLAGGTVTGDTTFSADIIVATGPPASASATGVAGTITWDVDYIYVCTDTDTWKRVAIATWP
jgi:hypothetical protein